jgi:TolA-binding protein
MATRSIRLLLPGLGIAVLALGGCASNKHSTATIESLSKQEYKFEEPALSAVEEEQVMEKYRVLLNTAQEGDMHSEAMRRLADLQLEVGELDNLSDDPTQTQAGQAKMQAAIDLYLLYLETYPGRPGNDLILYQLSKAYALNGESEKGLETLDRLVRDYPNTRYLDEVQFRRGETLFVFRDYYAAEQAYGVVVNRFPESTYFEKALYKYGWSLYKQHEYTRALDSFVSLLDIKEGQGMINEDRLAPELPRTEQELLTDTLRVVSLSFSSQDGANTIRKYLSSKGQRPYEALLYRQLGELYISKDRITDAAEVYLAFVDSNPESHLAPQLHTDAIDAYRKANFPDLVLSAKEEFVQRYGVDSRFWEIQTEENRAQIQPLLTRHISELATHYHAVAKKTSKVADYKRAAGWYDTYLRSFPNDKDAAQINFLLAETLYEGKQYVRAVNEYEKAAYNYPVHAKSAEAGYAALLSYKIVDKQLAARDKPAWQQRSINSALRFSAEFPNDKRVPAVLAKTSEELYALKDYQRASSTAKVLLQRKDITDPKLRRTAQIVYGHSQFELGDYLAAESAYQSVLKGMPTSDKEYAGLSDRLAASIYKQGEAARDRGEYVAAAGLFMRVGESVPKSSLRATAQYDAATMYIQAGDWGSATRILEDFRKRYPENKKLQQGVTEKLAAAYTETGQGGKAATEMLALAALSPDPTYRRDMMLQAAQLYDKSGKKTQAVSTYKDYVRKYPRPVAQSMEARHYLAEHYRKINQPELWGYWLNEIVKADASAGSQRSPRTKYLAAKATFDLSKPYYRKYQQARLTLPLKKSLANKKKLMQDTVTMYDRAIKYQVAEVTTAATYQLAEVYYDFAQALMKSDRPRNLNADELEMYDILLEEQAYPFEEKSIDIHAANLKRAREGIYDEWVKKSLATLAKLQPVRYAKKEKTEAYVEAASN